MRSSLILDVAGGHADQLRSLWGWLAGEEELRGRVRLVHREPERGALGAVPEALVVVLGPGGLATALASSLIAWLRHRTTDVIVKVTRPDGSRIEVSAKRARDTGDLRELVAELSGVLDTDGADDARSSGV